MFGHFCVSQTQHKNWSHSKNIKCWARWRYQQYIVIVWQYYKTSFTSTCILQYRDSAAGVRNALVNTRHQPFVSMTDRSLLPVQIFQNKGLNFISKLPPLNTETYISSLVWKLKFKNKININTVICMKYHLVQVFHCTVSGSLTVE